MPLVYRRLLSRCVSFTTAGLMALAILPGITRAEDQVKTEAPKPDTTKPDTTKSDAPKPDTTNRPAVDPTPYLTMLHERLNELGLSDAQKTKVDAIFTKAGDDMKAVVTDTKDAPPEERGQKMREVVTGIRERLMDVLTDEQATKAKEAFSRPAAGGGQGGAGVQALMQNLQKLDLSDDQKTKVKSLLDDMKKAMEALRAEAQTAGGDRTAFREKAQNISQDLRTHLQEILTPEQATKLKELMSQAGPTPASTPEKKPTEPAKP